MKDEWKFWRQKWKDQLYSGNGKYGVAKVLGLWPWGEEWPEMKFKYLHEVNQKVENELILEVTQWGNYYYDFHFTDKETKKQMIDLLRPYD